jgi:hypothetical protein
MSVVADVSKKAGLLWITAPGSPQAMPTWHHWHGDAAYVIAGGAEQPLRGLADAERVTVTVRHKPAGVLTWTATVTTVSPDSAEWAEVVPELHTKRLNSPDGQQAPERWARESVLIRLDPV